MNNQTVLVTGGSGFIGTAVCMTLANNGHNVINIDRVKKDIKGVTHYTCDFAGPEIYGVLKLFKPTTIIHLAADHEIGRSVIEPNVFYQNNVANTIRLLDYAVNLEIKNFIFSSTSSVYGDDVPFPTAEKTPKNPVNPYGRSKSMVEDILLDFSVAFNIKHVSLRYFNAAGAVPDLSHGYTQNPASHLIPIVCQRILNNESVMVYGNSYDTKDGTCERDYTHLMDIVDAHILAMNYLNNGGESDVFNIGSGECSSVMDVIRVAEAIANKPAEYKIVEPRAGDPVRTRADIQKSRAVLGFSPKYSLEDTIKDAYAWAEKNIKKKKKGV